MSAATEVIDRPGTSRYEVLSDGEVAGYVRYRHEGDHIVLVHVELVPAFEGRGLASVLARGVFEDLRARGVGVDPQCPYMARWIGTHPEYSDVVVGRAQAAPDTTA